MNRLPKLAALALALCAYAGTGAAQVTTPNPILFVTQFPVPNDFAAIGSVFANHRADVSTVGRGGDLYIRYGNGTLRNLTREAGFGEAGEWQLANAIAVRDPAVHWSGTRALFSMTIGAPPAQYQYTTEFWQLYEVTGLGLGETAVITKVPNQPANAHNVMGTYASDGQIIFVSDRPHNGQQHLYPQHDEYESTPTPTGLWKLNPANGTLRLLQHSPSGSFDPIIDSFGRVLFTRWDHLQRDQQNEDPNNEPGTFNYTSEAPGSTPTASRAEVFPEPRIAVQGSGVEGFTINHFFPWQIRQDGTEEETLNHLGRHELHTYFNHSFSADPNLADFVAEISGRNNPRAAFNFLQLTENPSLPGEYFAIDAPEFNTHAAGQIIRMNAGPSVNPANVIVDYITHPDTEGTTPTPNHSGHYRNPLMLSNGLLIAAHATAQGMSGNAGTRANPDAIYKFRLRTLSTQANTFQGANLALTTGLSRTVRYWDPDVQVNYTGEFWELSPVEVVARTAPAVPAHPIPAPEQTAFTQRNVSPAAFQEYLRQQNLAVVVMRDVTTRDVLDRQQPFNLRVPAGRQTPLNPTGTVYDIGHMQFFQGDLIRGIGGMANPTAGRRVLAQHMHEAAALAGNGTNPGGPTASVPIASDGSVAAYVPAGRAMTWQTTAPNGTPVVRERFWITFQPGEVRACDGCHGVNVQSQSGQPASQQVSQAFLDLLQRWNNEVGILFSNGFE
ncbi:MAG: hypothetical protein IPK97_01325 [Ahniella sp.]|nr:hypothetical protein [Ahniella sp.]